MATPTSATAERSSVHVAVLALARCGAAKKCGGTPAPTSGEPGAEERSTNLRRSTAGSDLSAMFTASTSSSLELMVISSSSSSV